MATKRTSKKKAARRAATKRATPRKRTTSRKAQQGGLRSLLLRSSLLLLALTVALALTYHFSPYSVRGRIERIGLVTVNVARSPEWMPKLITKPLEWLHDCIPNNEGMLVDGGELGYAETPFIAGVPQGRTNLRQLQNVSSTNLFNERERQSVLIATYLSAEARDGAKSSSSFYDDPRIPTLKPSQLSMGEWTAQPLIPSKYLAKWHGPKGANEAHLATQLVPMRRDLANGTWGKLMDLLANEYPNRFQAIWLYTGPAYRVQHAKFSSGIPVPDGFYAVAFHLTDGGGLRAIAFLVPHEHEVKRLRDCITSIARIEEVTGLNVLPELDYDARESLRNWISPGLW